MAEAVHQLTSGRTTAAVAGHGAELQSLRTAGREAIWPAGPAWLRHAPVLFPIVGGLRGDRLIVDGQAYTMGKHGFARDRAFAWTRRDRAACALTLQDDDRTRAMFPYPFRLDLEYELEGPALCVTARVTNTGSSTLPCALGFHPAFNWPLGGGAKEAHRIELSAVEAASIPQLDAAGLLARDVPNPLRDRREALLSDALFAHDALIFAPVRSRSARYVAPDGAAVEVAWEHAAQLGIWSKPADFVCIEPWRGHADPASFDGEFRDKPGLMHIAPGACEELRMTITTQW